MTYLERIISGGQTGADRGGLDAGLALGIPIGGTCPKGRRAEDGRIPDVYTLTDSVSSGYKDRTDANIVNSDLTVIVATDWASKGTRYTISRLNAMRRPYVTIDIRNASAVVWPGYGVPSASPPPYRDLASYIEYMVKLAQRPIVLNVAGNRESVSPGIQAWTRDFLIQTISRFAGYPSKMT